ncbi:MAG: phospho-N-acetylmuramoyl-pentapeptide-transferase [Oscillospiraceae bacterium]|nr:phospho-N-acetylmuramoyl-pentapeptide-transferase [Oscillospiraceae bacterium]
MTVWTVAAAAIAFAVSAIIGRWLIPYLRRLHFGQTILEIGPNWHKNKQGTPTMGGLMFIAGILIAVAVCFAGAALTDGAIIAPMEKIHNVRLVSGILMALAFGVMGFADDYVKVAKKRNLGLTARQKLICQFIISAIYLWSLYLGGDTTNTVIIPFIGQLKLGVLYYPLCAVGIVYITNSVNLTDGLDGLSSSVTVMASLGLMGAAAVLGVAQVSIMAAAVAGGCLGFLIYNFYPAKVFMGDTGSMFLGGCIVAMAFGIGMPLILAFCGIIYVVESMSVVLQVISFKTTGKRIFKMSPIHHHFEMCGYSEVQIVFAFAGVTLLMSVLTVFAAMNV